MVQLIYVTGDLHGDITRFKSKEFKKLRRRDTLIVCGDFGFLWDNSKQEQKILKWIGKRSYTVLFVEGAHDNLSLLYDYPITDWNGGKVREISGKLRHLCRGSIFEIEGKKIFAFGGGEPQMVATEDSAWWDRQLPQPEELDAAWKNLEAQNDHVDAIVTHQSSRKIKKLLTMEDNEANVLDVFLDEVREKCTYTGWYFGSYHIDRVIPPSEMAVFERVIPVLDRFDLELLAGKKRK